jgi:hypothetical protein
MDKEIPDLSRTKAALEVYDAFDSEFDAEGSQDDVLAEFAELERFGKAVGRAFGLDTADRNNVDDCERCIRPGNKVPPAGMQLSFVRRMVERWEEQEERHSR